jgi:hypothetical protein
VPPEIPESLGDRHRQPVRKGSTSAEARAF